MVVCIVCKGVVVDEIVCFVKGVSCVVCWWIFMGDVFGDLCVGVVLVVVEESKEEVREEVKEEEEVEK